MNYLLFTLEYPPFKGGVANYYSNLVRFWPKKDNIFVLNNNDNKLLLKHIWPHWIGSIFALQKEIKKNKINHIIVGHILPLGISAYYISKLNKISYTVILHGMDFAYALRYIRKKRMTEKILNKATNIICPNSYTADLVKNFLNDKYANKIYIVSPGIDPNYCNHN